MDKKVIPAILTDTLNHLEEEVKRVENFADFVQVDYVDGYFAPEITCCEAKIIREVDILPSLEVHLMVEEPIHQVKEWFKAGASRIVGQIEEMDEQLDFVTYVSKMGLEVGLALNLETPITDLDFDVVEGLNVILLMAHEVGIQGSPFRRDVLKKVTDLRSRYPHLNIEVDGGINKDTITDALRAGANYFAVGSDIFNAKNPQAEYDLLLSLVK